MSVKFQDEMHFDVSYTKNHKYLAHVLFTIKVVLFISVAHIKTCFIMQIYRHELHLPMYMHICFENKNTQL